MRGELYQKVLIALGVITTLLFGVFLYRELFPEYKIYQNDYVALEEFRSTYSGEPAPAFQFGVKQVVQLKENKGPPTIDRCTSCHVALEFSHFSPTKVSRDINGNIEYNADGFPFLVKNEDYVWARLDDKIAELRNEKVNEQLKSEGRNSEVKQRLRQAEDYEALKTAKVGDRTYEIDKVLTMHPLIGRETRPFEYHPIEEYGCTSCHSGNGNGLTTEKAHGPVFDGQYETEFVGYVPKFTESDPANDPKFSGVFNHKPGHELLFQTTPILVGNLIQARCVQCHKTSNALLEGLYNTANLATTRRQQKSGVLENSYNDDIEAFIALNRIQGLLKKEGVEKVIARLQVEDDDNTIPAIQHERLNAQILYLKKHKGQNLDEAIKNQLLRLVGDASLLSKLQSVVNTQQEAPSKSIKTFINDNRGKQGATGSLFTKADAVNLEAALVQHAQDAEQSFAKTTRDPKVLNAITSDIDLLTQSLQNGQNLFLSQACYACHRIAGISRGGVGPELTQEGKKYPWFIKESIVWPQADVKTSTMPNFRLDHEELESLMTFLLSQTGQRKSDSETGTKVAIQEWEAGRKLPWEQAITPDKIEDLHYSMEVFATEGCSACHRLKGFESNVGFAIEKDKPSFDSLYKEHQWFQSLIPEELPGSQLAAVIDANSKEIDARIVDNVRQGSIIEQIETKYPGTLEALYTNFKYAARAKNHQYENLIAKEDDPAKQDLLRKELQNWKARVSRVLMAYIQEYGLGRLIGPRPNWSGIYRSDEWLMEHFKNPSAHVARSIMPVFPFDDTKFFALTKMLDTLGIRNRDAVHEIWTNRGFNPEEAFEIHCAQCHGTYLQGNGPVAEWIYPIPKNLRNSDFLVNLTKQKAFESILHGVMGTPMAPWGEVATDKPSVDGKPVLSRNEIRQLVDWIYSTIPQSSSVDVQKWKYTPEDVLDELKKEGGRLEPKHHSFLQTPQTQRLYAALEPQTTKAVDNDDVVNYFDVFPNPNSNTDKNLYFIKKKYYTPENLEKGKEFFELNCAACHGKDADGSGLRATAMADAKPRMLTNLDWINSHDDLRLLRSIKYGVQGTSMTPWGDLTSSMQRMQLVMFIRSLSNETALRSQLLSSIYKSYSVAQQIIEIARKEEYAQITKTKNELNTLREQLDQMNKKIENGTGDPAAAIQLYQQYLQQGKQLHLMEERDNILKQLIDLILKERDTYADLGYALISKHNDNFNITPYFDLIASNEGKFIFKDGKLSVSDNPERKNNILSIQSSIEQRISSIIENLKTQQQLLKGKIPSATITQELQDLNLEISGLEKMNAKLLSSLAEAKRIDEQQIELVNLYNAQSGKQL